MARATIGTHLGDGRYTITQHYDTTQIDGVIARLNASISEILSKTLPAAIVEEAAAEAEDTAAQAAFDAAISAFSAETITQAELVEAQEQAVDSAVRLAEATRARQSISTALLALQKRLAYLTAGRVASKEITAWSADYATTLSGDVGTIDVDGDFNEVIIYPGTAPALDSAYDSARDGARVQPIAQSPEGCYYNWAMRAGWQRYKPSYRIGVMSNRNTTTNTCDVTLLTALAGDRNIHAGLSDAEVFPDINQTPTLTAVPIEYSSCNARAFADGDEVVVEFTGRDWLAPKVIGFRTNPKRCDYRFTVYDANGAIVTPDSVIEFIAPPGPAANVFWIHFKLYTFDGVNIFPQGSRYMQRDSAGVKSFTQISFDTATNEWVFLGSAANPLVYVDVRVKQHIWTIYPSEITNAGHSKFVTGTPIPTGEYSIALEAFAAGTRTPYEHVTNGRMIEFYVATTQPYWALNSVGNDDLGGGCINTEDPALEIVTYQNSYGTIDLVRDFSGAATYPCVEEFDGTLRTAPGLVAVTHWISGVGTPSAPSPLVPSNFDGAIYYWNGDPGNVPRQPFSATNDIELIF